MDVLVVNVGSSSLKIRLVGPDDVVSLRVDVELHPDGLDRDGLAQTVAPLAHRVDAVGHRVVHGGARFRSPVVVEGEVEDALRELTPLAPLHQRGSLEGIDVFREILPHVPAVACFDTAFHATMPDEAATYALPASWRQGLGVRRYGFHGLSHAYASQRVGAMMGCPAHQLRTVTCHLGAGASLAAVAGGVSVDTTMGFTPLDGLVMATRSGSVDPGLVIWLVQEAGLTVEEVARALEHESGLLAVAGTADMATVVARAGSGDSRARLALGLYVHRLRAGIASMASAMGGLDTLVFTGGVGEHAATVRHQAAKGLGFLGIEIDEAANLVAVPDVDLTAAGASVHTVVIEAREDIEIARQVRGLLHTGTLSPPP